jgi:hypothetical protein
VYAPEAQEVIGHTSSPAVPLRELDLPGLADPVQESERALFEQPSCSLVVIPQTRVGEQMAGTWVEEQFCVLDLFDQRLGRTPIFLCPWVAIMWI